MVLREQGLRLGNNVLQLKIGELCVKVLAGLLASCRQELHADRLKFLPDIHVLDLDCGGSVLSFLGCHF